MIWLLENLALSLALMIASVFSLWIIARLTLSKLGALGIDSEKERDSAMRNPRRVINSAAVVALVVGSFSVMSNNGPRIVLDSPDGTSKTNEDFSPVENSAPIVLSDKQREAENRQLTESTQIK